MSKNSINLSKIKLVNPKKSERLNNDVESLISSIKNHIYEVYTNINDSKCLNFGFILFVCNMLESADIDNTNKKIDKKKLVVRIMTELFINKSHDEDYIDSLNQFIEFLHDNNLIKSSSVTKVIKTTLLNYASKKLLGI